MKKLIKGLLIGLMGAGMVVWTASSSLAVSSDATGHLNANFKILSDVVFNQTQQLNFETIVKPEPNADTSVNSSQFTVTTAGNDSGPSTSGDGTPGHWLDASPAVTAGQFTIQATGSEVIDFATDGVGFPIDCNNTGGANAVNLVQLDFDEAGNANELWTFDDATAANNTEPLTTVTALQTYDVGGILEVTSDATNQEITDCGVDVTLTLVVVP